MSLDPRVVFAQQGHHVFWVRTFREARKAAQVTEEGCDLAPMALQLFFISRRDDQVGYLRGQGNVAACPCALFRRPDWRRVVPDAGFSFSTSSVLLRNWFSSRAFSILLMDCLRGKVLKPARSAYL